MKRLTSGPFPLYRFLPGRSPHPRRDSKGHSYGKPDSTDACPSPELWKSSHLYLYGIDLFNHGFFWEAHEAWEALWKSLNPEAIQAIYLQAITQLTASKLKYILDEQDGERELLRKARTRLERVEREAGSPYMGVDLSNLLNQLEKPDLQIDVSVAPV